jgi:hypothetical protein
MTPSERRAANAQAAEQRIAAAREASKQALLDALDFDRSRAMARASQKGFDVRSTTTSEGRTVAVILSAEFARLIAHLLSGAATLATDVGLGSEVAVAAVEAFAADLAKVNP